MNKKVPEIRFDGFNEKWEQRKLDKLVDRVKSYSLSRNVETNDETGIKYVHYGDIHKKVADKVTSKSSIPNIIPGNYETLIKGDLVLADASEDYQGIATPAIILENTPFKIVSGLHTIALRPKKIDSKFLYYLFNSPIFKRYGYRVGTGMKVFGISISNVLKFEVVYSTYSEQKKIGIFLKKLEDTIALHQHELENLKKSKKAFLQKMFPKEGETVPEIRFPGFNDDWKPFKLGEISPLRGGFAFKSLNFSESGIPIVRISNILENGSIGGEFVFYNIQENDENYLLPDRAAVLAMSGATTGKVSILSNPDNAKIYQNQRVGYFMNTDNADYLFISTLVRSNLFINRLKSVLVAGAQPNVSSKDINDFEFNIPNSINEQNEIGSFFKNLDNSIALHQSKLDQLEKLKKVFLQKMFV